MNSNPLISIIIPMYNAQKYILETIESVLNQTYLNWEMIIVDNFSTDDSRNIVKSINDTRIKLIELNSNSGGPARPRNIGIENSKGEYIAFLDADDLWIKDKLEIQLHDMLENDFNFSSTGKININEKSENINFKAEILSKLDSFKRKETICDFIRSKYIYTSSVMIMRERIVSFTEEKKMVSVEDFCAWLEVLDNVKTKYKYINKPLLKYRIVQTSISDRGVEFKQANKAYLCLLNHISKYDKYEYMKCFFKMCWRDYSLNFLQKLIRKS